MDAGLFSNLYQFVTSTGVVIPQTSSVKTDVESVFKTVFGNDFSTDTETPGGRLIEAITILIKNVVSVNAQNANNMNPRTAIGEYIDALGAMFGVSRLEGESDYEYRKRLLESQSRGTGFTQSIRAAISAVSGVTSVEVLENGYEYPMILPNADDGIAVKPHSVFICVAGGTDAAVAQAIYSAKSAGCGYTNDAEGGTLITSNPIVDSTTGSSNTVQFYRPATLAVTVNMAVYDNGYTGSDISTDVKNTVIELFKKKGIGSRITQADVISAVAVAGYGVTVKSVSFMAGGQAVDYVQVAPYQVASVPANSITVVVE